MMEKVDFLNSSITWITKREESYGRFMLESICFLHDEKTEMGNLYCLGAEVLAGNVYATDGLVKKPNYLFQIVASHDRHTIFRSYLQHNPVSDSSAKNDHLFNEIELNIIKQPAVTLHDFQAIGEHFDKFSQLSARITNPHNSTINTEIEFPVKHINLQRTQMCFRVETGPVLFPTKISSAADMTQSMPEFNPAFIHINRLDEIEITLKVPTRLGSRSTSFYSETKFTC